MGSKSLTDSSTDIRTMFERSQERLLVWPPGLHCMESPALRMCAQTLSSASRWFILTGTVDVTGVVDYDSSEQVGTFRMETAGGLLEIPNVHSYTVFIRWKGRYLTCLYKWQPEADLLNDVIISAIVKEGGKFNWVLFCSEPL